ncbi:MAG: hypothetical protein ACI4VP_05420 [Clostridia bacterium]
MKTLKRIEMVAILLFVAIIIFASFFGVYKKEDFRTVNIIKDYKLGMQFTNTVVLNYKPTTEEKEVIYNAEGDVVIDDGQTEYTEENGYTVKNETVNNEQNLTKENYKLTKKILKNRLKGMNVGEYELKLNEETGEITITLQDNDDVHEISEHLGQKGLFNVIDKETKISLLDYNDVKSAKAVYGSSDETGTSTTVYLQINFNKDGAKKLEEISTVYVKSAEEQENEEGEKEEVDTTKYVSVVLDGQTYSSTYFGEKMSTGVLYIPIAEVKNNEDIEGYVKEINNIATIINNEVLPIDYDFSEEHVETKMTQNMIFIGIAIPVIILVAACIVLIVKFKAKGFITTFLQIGYIALLLLVIRYTNVVITIEGILGIIISAILNYILVYAMLSNLKKKGQIEWKLIGKFALRTIIVYILAVVLAFNSLTRINSFGMALVWGSFCLYIYNLAITRNVLKMLNK